MPTWLYQLSTDIWQPERYRLEIWEGERWNWPVGGKSGGGQKPQAGDTVVFFYAPSRATDPGFYGWAVVLEWFDKSSSPLYFRPTSPSDRLKMDPWWNDEAKELAEEIRGPMKQRTLWMIQEELVPRLRQGIRAWLASKDG